MSTLAIDGGKSIRTLPFPPWPHFEKEEIEAMERVLRSGRVNYWTGEEGRFFEKEYAESVGCTYGIAVANGSVALELALLALGIGPGDEVIVTPRTFIASASCIVIRGAKPVFADVDLNSGNITAENINRVLSPKTKALICVHLAGWPCDMDKIMNLASEKNLWVIEDCAQAHGALYYSKEYAVRSKEKEESKIIKNGKYLYPRQVGSFGHITCFSFCQDKILTTGGEGGMLITNDKAIWGRAWSYKDHGKSYDAVYNKKHPREFHWLHESIGTNWRLTEMQSAIGRVILRKLPNWVETRRKNAAILTECFSKRPALRVTIPPEEISHAYYKYYVFVRPERLRKEWNRDRIMNAICAEGIPCFSGSCSEIYLEKAFEKEGLKPKARFPMAKELGETSLMFLVHPTLSEQDMEDTCTAVKKILDKATE